MVSPRRHLMVVILCAGFVALLFASASIRVGTATARPYTWTDFGPSSGGSGDQTGDDQPSPTPKPSKSAQHHIQVRTPGGAETAFRTWNRATIIWNAYRRLLPLVPRI